jgi:carbon storage regulator
MVAPGSTASGPSPRGRLPLPPGEEVGKAVLVLTRKTNQSIMIGDDVEVSILSVSGDKVRIGIAAPREVGVFRKEVYTALEPEDLARREADATT